MRFIGLELEGMRVLSLGFWAHRVHRDRASWGSAFSCGPFSIRASGLGPIIRVYRVRAYGDRGLEYGDHTVYQVSAYGDRGLGLIVGAPKKHTSKNKDRDIPYKPPYNEDQ